MVLLKVPSPLVLQTIEAALLAEACKATGLPAHWVMSSPALAMGWWRILIIKSLTTGQLLQAPLPKAEMVTVVPFAATSAVPG